MDNNIAIFKQRGYRTGFIYSKSRQIKLGLAVRELGFLRRQILAREFGRTGSA